MDFLLIVYQNESFKKSIIRYYNYVFPRKLCRINSYRLDFLDLSVLDEFTHFCSYIDKSYNSNQLLKTGVIVEYPLKQIMELGFRLNPINHINEKSVPAFSLLCMMVLFYPELRFFFFGIKKHPSDYDSDISGKHYLSTSITSTHLKTLSNFPGSVFDGYGLRSEIRVHLTKDEETKNDCRGTPVRKRLAAALDEEDSYSYFNAYTTLRFGYLSFEFSSYKKASWALQGPLIVEFLFEDLYMSFPDQESGASFSDLEDRDQKVFKGLISEKIKHRILVTVGHKHNEHWKKNKSYLDSIVKKRNNFRYKMLYKPTGGMFDLWKSSGMWNKQKDKPLLAAGYIWPPEQFGKKGDAGGHSAPGRLLLIAQKLIDRSETILNKAITVPEAIHAAVLALEAKELLGNRTPTTSLEALSLQHEAEITAESMFYGVKYNLNVRDRLNDIKLEVRAISSWFHEDGKKASEINARLGVVQKLAKRFRLMNQFEEEQACLAEARNLRFAFWMRQKPLNRIAWPLLKYIEHALYSLPRFFFILFLWTVLFGFLYHIINSVWGSEPKSFLEAFTASMRPFFAAEPSDYWVDLENAAGPPGRIGVTIWNLIVSIQGFISAFNLTLLIAHIYLIVSRR